MNNFLFTGILIYQFIGLRTIVLITEESEDLIYFLQYAGLIVLSSWIVITVNYFVSASSSKEFLYVSIPMLSLASGVLIGRLFKKLKRSIIYMTLFPAGAGLLAVRYANSGVDYFIFAAKNSIEFLSVALFIFILYRSVRKKVLKLFKGAPAILIIAALINMLLKGLIQ